MTYNSVDQTISTGLILIIPLGLSDLHKVDKTVTGSVRKGFCTLLLPFVNPEPPTQQCRQQDSRFLSLSSQDANKFNADFATATAAAASAAAAADVLESSSSSLEATLIMPLSATSHCHFRLGQYYNKKCCLGAPTPSYRSPHQ